MIAGADSRSALDGADREHCRRLLWGGSKSFAAASLLLPGRVRRPATAVYAFCRVSDDAVDRPDAGVSALTNLRRRTILAYAGEPIDDPVDRQLARAVLAAQIPRGVVEALLEGFAWDLAGRRYHTLDDVIAYAARVAASVGVMMTLLMGRRDEETLARAIDLGVAMQLTNIARDVGEDAQAGRCYLPEAWLSAVGLSSEGLISGPEFSPELGAVVRRLLDTADTFYRRSEAGIGRLPLDCRPAIAAARLIYCEIGAGLAQRGYDSVSGRAVVSRVRKLQLLTRALPFAAAGRRPALGPPHPETQFLLNAVRDAGNRVAAPAPRREAM